MPFEIIRHDITNMKTDVIVNPVNSKLQLSDSGVCGSILKKAGIENLQAANYNCNSDGTELNFSAINDVLCCVRRDKHISEGWKEKIKKILKRKEKTNSL